MLRSTPPTSRLLIFSEPLATPGRAEMLGCVKINEKITSRYATN
jgi:hypothetical protein